MNMLSMPALKAVSQRQWSARKIADAAVRALCDEALLTPKPALVDRNGSGAHRDMDLPMLLRSALTLRATFEKIARSTAAMSPTTKLRERLTDIGIRGEREMLAATGGVNTHRGAIWTLGLLCASRAMLDETATANDLCACAARIARLPAVADTDISHGRSMHLQFGARGARGEAEDGFPQVYEVALPALRESRVLGHDETHAQLTALLHLIASVEDTCLLYRGGAEALSVARIGSESVLSLGVGTAAGKLALAELDRKLLGLNASPGGSADLLAATLLLDRFVPAMENI